MHISYINFRFHWYSLETVGLSLRIKEGGGYRFIQCGCSLVSQIYKFCWKKQRRLKGRCNWFHLEDWKVKKKKLRQSWYVKAKKGEQLNKKLLILREWQMYLVTLLKSMICEWSISREKGNPFQGAGECKINEVVHYNICISCFSRLAFLRPSFKINYSSFPVKTSLYTTM